MKGWNIDQISKSPVAPINKHLIGEPGSGNGRAKYKNTKTNVDGIQFDSAKEADHYKILKMLLKAGKISFLERQVPFELNPGGTHSLKYIADFTYYDRATNKKMVVDVKGFRTREYLKKRRLMKKVHNIIITEI